MFGVLGTSKACETVPSWEISGNDNPDPGKPCRFPFKWSGVTHNSCVQDDGGAWCSTEVNRRGEYIDRKWGVCSNRCPGKKSKSLWLSSESNSKKISNF